MGRLVVVNFVSMDGVIQSPLSADEDRDGAFGRGGWVVPYSDDTVAAFMRNSTVDAAGMLLGRRTYEILADAWSQADESEPAVAAMNRMPKYVVTRSPGVLGWSSSHRLEGDLATAVGALVRRVTGKLVVFGSGGLIPALVEHDLIDEYRLLLFPVVLGAGKRMFADRGAFTRFTLADSTVTPSGVVLLDYVRREET